MDNTLNFLENYDQMAKLESKAVSPSKKGRPRTIDRNKVALLRQQGYSRAQIAEELGCSTRGVNRIYNELDNQLKLSDEGQRTQTITTRLLPEIQDDSYRPWNQPFFGLLEEQVAPASISLDILFEKDETGHFSRLGKYPQYNHYGVYGLYRNNQLVYIGSTSRPFKERIREHYQNIQKTIETGKSNFQVYSLFAKEDKISVSILIDMYEVGYKQLTERDLRAMELAMITYFAPVGNVSGLKQGFQF